MTKLSPKGRRVLHLLYFVGALILFDQILDVVSLVWPLRFGIASWRFGTFGLTISRLEVLAIADALILATAVFLEQRVFLRILGAVHLLVGLVLLAGVILFALDGLQLRQIVQPERKREMTIAGIRSLLLSAAAGLSCLVAGWVLWRREAVSPKRDLSPESYLTVRNAEGRVHE